ncbi:hypothetical protein BGZ60DRAFT_425063 [Tricladium varicosporioides]|nr:hypothetical protein BGZ60DRAFT_425063 [Hymenoscyphus varicosporioides]
MQFTIVALLSLVAVAFASPIRRILVGTRLGLEILTLPHTHLMPSVLLHDAPPSPLYFVSYIQLQSVSTNYVTPAIDAEAPSMSNQNGDVVSFDSTAVVQPMTASGQ